MDLYRDEILAHYKHSVHKKRLDNPTHSGFALNPNCGDALGLEIKVSEGGVIEDLGFWGEGCAISQAAMSMLAGELVGRKIGEVSEIAQDDILSLLGVEIGSARLKCALLPLDVLRKIYEHEKS